MVSKRSLRSKFGLVHYSSSTNIFDRLLFSTRASYQKEMFRVINSWAYDRTDLNFFFLYSEPESEKY